MNISITKISIIIAIIVAASAIYAFWYDYKIAGLLILSFGFVSYFGVFLALRDNMGGTCPDRVNGGRHCRCARTDPGRSGIPTSRPRRERSKTAGRCRSPASLHRQSKSDQSVIRPVRQIP